MHRLAVVIIFDCNLLHTFPFGTVVIELVKQKKKTKETKQHAANMGCISPTLAIEQTLGYLTQARFTNGTFNDF